MIAYCPLDEEPVERPSWYQENKSVASSPSRPRSNLKSKSYAVLGQDDTECNYVVMFFIAGVIALAIMDSLPRK